MAGDPVIHENAAYTIRHPEVQKKVARFEGSLWLADQATSKLTVEVDVRDEGVVVVTARDMTIGEWPHTDLIVEPSEDGVHIIAEGEELIFETATPGFVDALTGLRRPPRRRARHASLGAETGTDPTDAKRSHLRPRLIVAWAALLAGLLAVALTIPPSLRVAAIATGVLAVVLGVAAGHKREWWEEPLVKGLGSAGAALGIVAISLVVLRVEPIGERLGSAAEGLGHIIATVGEGSGSDVVLQLQQCSANGAAGIVANNDVAPVEVVVAAYFVDDEGVEVARGTALLKELAPGRQKAWEIPTGGADYAHCRAEIQHAARS